MTIPATPSPPPSEGSASDLRFLRALERKVLWLAVWTIHHANHLRPSRDGLKVGGHQASCASVAALMTALYFDALRPEDLVGTGPGLEVATADRTVALGVILTSDEAVALGRQLLRLAGGPGAVRGRPGAAGSLA